MKRCPKCGSSIGTNTTFCWNCGAKLSGGKFLKKSKRKTHRKIWNIIAIMVAMMLVGYCLVNLYLQGNSKKPKVATADETITFLKKMGRDYGFENALSDLTVDTITNIGGDAYYRLQQNYKGIPVYGQSIVAMTGDNGELKSIVGNTVDVPNEISLIPNVTKEQMNACIFEWLTRNLIDEENENIETSDIEIDTIDECSLCIYHGESGWTLAYTVEAYGYVFVLDAHSAEVLTVNTMFLPAIGYLASDTERTNGFEVSLEDDGRYGLVNEEYKILIYDLKGQNSDKKLPDVNDFVKSNDNIFGNAPEEQGFEDGAKELISLGKIAELFSAKYGFSTETGVILGYYNDGKSLGSNAFGGAGSDGIGYIFIGQHHATDDLDVLAHEFCHIVTSTKAHLDTSKKETRSVSEALSDIFGVLVEAKLNNWDEPDWVVETTAKGYLSGEHRSLSNPEEDGNYIKYTNTPFGSAYKHSTILSHSAYLMWNGINGTSEWKIPADTLMDLWYRAILMMPSDCDFITCRKMVEWAALSVDGLTDAQRNCIAEAFDTVGIHKPEVSPEILISCDYNAKPNSVLNVFNTSGELHPRYTLSISGTIAEHELAYSKDILTDIGYRYEKTVEVKKATSYKLNLPDGYYTLTVSDRHNPQYTYSFTVSISDKGTEDIIGLYTDFEDQLVVKVTEATAESEIIVRPGKQLTTAKTRLSDSSIEEYVYSYNHSGQLISRTNISYNNGAKTFAHDWEYIYNSSGQMTAEKDSNNYYDDYEYHYDGDVLIGYTYNDIRDGTIVISTTYHFERDTAGNIVSITTTGTDPDVWMNGKYTYNTDGYRISAHEEERYGDHLFERTMAYDYSYPGMVIVTEEVTMFGYSSTSRYAQIRDFEKHILGRFELLDGYSINTDMDGYITSIVDASGTTVHTFVYSDGVQQKNTEGERYNKKAIEGYEQAVRYFEEEIQPNYVVSAEKMTATYYCQTYGGMSGDFYGTISTSNLYTLSQVEPWLLAYNVADYNSDGIADLFVITLDGHGDGEIGQLEIRRRIYIFDKNGQVEVKGWQNTAASASEKKMVFAFIDDKLVELSFSDYSTRQDGNDATSIEYPVTEKILRHIASINVKEFNQDTNNLDFILSFSRYSYQSGKSSWDSDYGDYKTEYDAMLAFQDLLHENCIYGVEMPVSDRWENRWNDDFYLSDKADWNAFALNISSTTSELTYGVGQVGGDRYDGKTLLNTTTGTTVFSRDKYELAAGTSTK